MSGKLINNNKKNNLIIRRKIYFYLFFTNVNHLTPFSCVIQTFQNMLLLGRLESLGDITFLTLCKFVKICGKIDNVGYVKKLYTYFPTILGQINANIIVKTIFSILYNNNE